MTDNELIAEFLGYKFKNDNTTHPDGIWENESYWDYPKPPVSPAMFTEEMKFDTSFDWLILAIKKFDTTPEYSGYWVGPQMDEYIDLCDKIENTLTTNYDITEVFPVVVEAVKWYKTNGRA